MKKHPKSLFLLSEYTKKKIANKWQQKLKQQQILWIQKGPNSFSTPLQMVKRHWTSCWKAIRLWEAARCCGTQFATNVWRNRKMAANSKRCCWGKVANFTSGMSSTIIPLLRLRASFSLFLLNFKNKIHRNTKRSWWLCGL